jgi:hypothetical protein
VTLIEPDNDTLPAQPSPLTPPDALQSLAFCEVQLSVTLSPTARVTWFADNVVDGRGTAGGAAATPV